MYVSSWGVVRLLFNHSQGAFNHNLNSYFTPQRTILYQKDSLTVAVLNLDTCNFIIHRNECHFHFQCKCPSTPRVFGLDPRNYMAAKSGTIN